MLKGVLIQPKKKLPQKLRRYAPTKGNKEKNENKEREESKMRIKREKERKQERKERR